MHPLKKDAHMSEILVFNFLGLAIAALAVVIALMAIADARFTNQITTPANLRALTATFLLIWIIAGLAGSGICKSHTGLKKARFRHLNIFASVPLR
jgi:hypothetical protein